MSCAAILNTSQVTYPIRCATNIYTHHHHHTLQSVGVADIEDLAGPPAAGAALLLPPRAAAAAAATADDVEEVALGAGQVLKVRAGGKGV